MGKRANGEGTWAKKTIGCHVYESYGVSINGKRKYFYGKTKKEALEKYRKFTSMPEVGQDNIAVIFSDYCSNWLQNYKKDKIKPKTYDYYESIINGYIVGTILGSTTIKKLNSMQFKEYTSLFNDHLITFRNKSKSTLDGIHTVLTQVCKYGITYQDLSHNFMQGVEKVSEKDVGTKKKEIIALEYEDVIKLWNEMLRKNEPGNVINGKVGEYVYGIGAYALLFCCFTGLRWGEVSALQWSDIQEYDGKFFFKVDKQFITIKNRDSKNKNKYTNIIADPKSKKSIRYIPLPQKAIELLNMVKERYPEQNKSEHLIFSTSNKPYGESVAHRLLKAMCIRANVRPVSPHVLRHSFASILLNNDEKNLYEVSDLLGHSSPDVTYKKYIDIFEKNKASTVSIFDKL